MLLGWLDTRPVVEFARSIAAEHRRGRFDAIHAFGSWTGAIAGLVGRSLRVPVIATFVGGEVAGVETAGYGAQLTASGRASTKFAARCARVVTVQSDFMRKLARDAGIEAVRLTLGVSTPDWPPSPPRRRIAGEPLRILHVAGRLLISGRRHWLRLPRGWPWRDLITSGHGRRHRFT